MSNKANLIRTIYLYVFSGVGLSLFLIGTFMAIQYLVNITQFDKYPLQSYEETACTDYLIPTSRKPMLPPGEDADYASPSADIKQRYKIDCEARLENDRLHRQVNDLTRTIAFIIIGLPVFLFHWRMARKVA